jgi:hypothetical protein
MLTQETPEQKPSDLVAAALEFRLARLNYRAIFGWLEAAPTMSATPAERTAAMARLHVAEFALTDAATRLPSERTRTTDIYDPLTGEFKPTQVPETLRLAPRERIPGDRIAITLDEFDRLQALEVDTEIASLGPPDPAEHDRVAAALEKGGTIAEGARVLGVSKRRMKLLIVQHRVTWPRARILPRKPASVESLVDFLGLGDYMREKVAEGETRMDEIRRQIMPGTAAAVDAGGDHALGSGEPKP